MKAVNIAMSDSESEFRTESQKSILTPLKLGVISLNGFISGIDLDEQVDIKKFKCAGNIVEIGSNFGVITTPGYAEFKRKKQQSRRSRTKKTKSNRKCKGSGTHIASQITFVVHSPEESKYKKPKYYKIKVFRTGHIQIPGVKELTYCVISKILNELINYLRKVYKSDAKLTNLVTTMQNFNCKVAYSTWRIKLNELKTQIDQYKATNVFPLQVINILNNLGFPDPKDDPIVEESDSDEDAEVQLDLLDLPKVPNFKTKSKITRLDFVGMRNIIRIMAGRTREQIAEVILEPDGSSSAVSVNFYRSSIYPFKVKRDKDPKGTWLNIMQSNKITIEGGNCVKEVEELRTWIMNFMDDRRDIIFGNTMDPYEVSDSISGDSEYADFELDTSRRKKD